MKNFFKKSSCAIMFTILLTSCSETVNHEFSHDDDINNWTKVNQKEISRYDRNDILDFSVKKQKAILRALPTEKKKAIWQQKINYIKNLKLSVEEKKYINWFSNIFEEINFNERTPKEVSSKMKSKALEAKMLFNWSNKFISEMFFLPGNVDLKTKIQKVKVVNNLNKIQQEEPSNCECKYDWGCPGGWSAICTEPEECKTNNNDCGFFSNDNCNGYCFGGGY